MKEKCTNCKKNFDIYDLVQVKDSYPKQPKYKLVCENCYEKGDFKFVGKLEKA